MTRPELIQWIALPTTKEFLELVEEKKNESLKALISGNTLTPDNIGLFSEIKGILNTLEELSDIEGFLEEKIDSEDRTNVKSTQST